MAAREDNCAGERVADERVADGDRRISAGVGVQANQPIDLGVVCERV